MEVQAFFPCEKAVVRNNGSTDILGFGIQQMAVKKKEDNDYAQVVINFFCILSFSAAESGQKTMQVVFIDQDGNPMSKSSAFNIDVPEKASNIRASGELPLIIKSSGRHCLQLVVNNRIEKEWSIVFKIT